MPLSVGDRRTIETFLGPLDSSEEAELDEATVRLGSPYAAALEGLLVLRGELASTVANLTSGGDSANTASNMPWVNAQIDRLVRFVNSSDDITFTGAAAELLAQVSSSLPTSTRTLPMVASNRRRG